MKNLNSLLAGIFLAVAFPFGTLVVSSQIQLGPLGRAPAEEGGPLFPSREPGLAIQGRAVYVSLGCVSCHTQQVRPAGQGSDIARGYGVRASVSRDYVLQKPVRLGERRIGPDLANYGARVKGLDVVNVAIKHDRQFAFLYTGAKQEVASERAIALAAYLQSLRQDYSSTEAKLKQ
jgi:cbb3-type cytochrome oxidase cytochrome c subunit